MRVYKLLVGLLIVLLFLNVAFVFVKKSRTSQVVLSGKTFYVEIADTDAARAQGLSGHKPLTDDSGMLFLFDHPDTYGFWMKDMTFPLDIIWIDEYSKVVYIEKSLSTSTYPTIYTPNTPARYVLEVSSGEVNKLQTKIGDSVQIIKK